MCRCCQHVVEKTLLFKPVPHEAMVDRYIVNAGEPGGIKVESHLSTMSSSDKAFLLVFIKSLDDESPNTHWAHIRIAFCPMCGERLDSSEWADGFRANAD